MKHGQSGEIPQEIILPFLKVVPACRQARNDKRKKIPRLSKISRPAKSGTPSLQKREYSPPTILPFVKGVPEGGRDFKQKETKILRLTDSPPPLQKEE